MSQYKILDKNSTKNKIILLRVDFNVPIDNKKIQDITRINKMKEIIHSYINNNNKIVLCSHLGGPKKNMKDGLSFHPIKSEIEKALDSEIDFKDIEKIEKSKIKKSKKNIFLLENIRFYPGEETNNDEFSEKLASIADVYINEAFSCSHRSHASINGVTKYIDSYAGETVIEEINALNKIITQTQKPVACLIGGSKISTKIDLIINLLPKMDYMIIGGAMANNFFKYDNVNIGKSYFEQVDISIVKSIHQVANRCGCKIILPTDVIVSQNQNTKGTLKKLNEVNNDDFIFDIGNETIKIIDEKLSKCKTVLWNGPFGLFENDNFSNGTEKIAKSVANYTKKNNLISVAGGGDTFAAIKKSNLISDFTYISTAGGAFLEWLEGKVLPGLKVLEK